MTTLDGDGYHNESGQHFPDCPYERAKVYKTMYYNHGKLDRTDYKLEVLSHTDYTVVRDENPILQNTQGFDEVDYKRLIEALRDYLPIEEHPNKHLYSAKDIFKQYREVHGLRNVTEVPFQYGSDAEHCICGHEIHEVCYCEYMSNKGPNGIIKPPLGAIGNCCIKKNGLEIWAIYALIK